MLWLVRVFLVNFTVSVGFILRVLSLVYLISGFKRSCWIWWGDVLSCSSCWSGEIFCSGIFLSLLHVQIQIFCWAIVTTVFEDLFKKSKPKTFASAYLHTILYLTCKRWHVFSSATRVSQRNRQIESNRLIGFCTLHFFC